MNTMNTVHNHPHGGAGVPDALQAVPPGSNDDGCRLPAAGSIPQCGQIIAKCLKTVQQVIQVLDLCNGPESPKCHSDSLPQDGCFPDPGIAHANLPKLLLHALQSKIHVSQFSRILPKNQCLRKSLEQRLKIVSKNHTSVHLLRFVRVLGQAFLGS